MKITNKINEVAFCNCTTHYFLYEGDLYQKMFAELTNDFGETEYNVYNISGRETEYFKDSVKVVPIKDIRVTLIW